MAAENEATGPASGGGRVARTYDRVARVYDWYEAPMDRLGGADRRRRVMGRARGRVLEVGIGTGLNLPHYPASVDLVGIDISGRMLERARRRAQGLGLRVRLEQADVEALPFADGSFDTVVASCVFCSVADPIQGLREVRRVLKPDGEVLLLEHVRPESPFFGLLFDLLSPVTRRLMGPELNRRTEANVEAAGLTITNVRRNGIWREITARE
jgi:ubiquinone/menaquinone biosynthesis C-methylase UbiE